MNQLYSTVDDHIVEQVLRELFISKHTAQDVGYILAKLDLDRTSRDEIVHMLYEAGLVKTLSPFSKVILKPKGIQTMEKGGWIWFKTQDSDPLPNNEPEYQSFFTRLKLRTSNSLASIFL